MRKWLNSVDVEVDAEGRAQFDKALANPSNCVPLTETASTNAWTEITLPAGTTYVHITVREASVYLVPADTAPTVGNGLVCLVNSERPLSVAGRTSLWAKSVVADAHGKVSGIAYLT